MRLSFRTLSRNPKELDKLHNDYTLAPQKKKINSI